MSDNEEPKSVSRRDFLRRASKEAVTTGVSLVPGARLAQTALGVGTETVAKKNWWQKMLGWRQERVAPTVEEDSEA